jgi:hypothetical protein
MLRFHKSFVLIKVRKKEDTMNSRKTCTLILKLTAGTVICTVGTVKAQALPSEARTENSSSKLTTSNKIVNLASHLQQTPTAANPVKTQQVMEENTSTSASQPIAKTLLHATPFPEREASALDNIVNSSPPEKSTECDPHQTNQSPDCSYPEPLSVPNDPDRSIFLQALGDSPASALQGTTERNLVNNSLLMPDSSGQVPPVSETEATILADTGMSPTAYGISSTDQAVAPGSEETDSSGNSPEGATEILSNESPEEENGNMTDSELEGETSDGSSTATESELDSGTDSGEGLNVNFNFSGSPSDTGFGSTEEFLGSETTMNPETTLPTTDTTIPESGITETTQQPSRQHKKQKLRKQIREELQRELRQKRNKQKRRKPINSMQPSQGSNPGINNKMNQDIYNRIDRRPLRRPARRMRVRSFRKHKMIFRQRSPRMRMRHPGSGFRMRHQRPFRMKRGRR